MTQQDDITQRVLTDDEINDLCGWRASNTTMRAENDRALAREVESALLSKLRAPVADERAAFEAEFPVPLHCEWIGNGYAVTEYNAWDASRHKYRWEGWKARAALASAPVAYEPPGGTRWPVLRAMARNYTAGKHTWDALDAEACEQAAEEIRHLRAALASAPVAGEARTALNEWFDKTDFIQKRIASGELPVKYLGWHRADVMRDLIDEAARNPVLPSGCIVVQEADTIPHIHPEYGPGIFFTEDARIEFDAAPQASAEDVRNAALEEAAKLMDQTLRSNGAALIRGLKRSQADKDGGQQRGGVVTDDMRYAVRFAPSSAYWSERLVEFFGPDAREGIDALERQLREARAMLDRQQRAGDVVRDALWTLTEHNALHFGEQHSTVIQGRAALSAPQAEQGEREDG